MRTTTLERLLSSIKASILYKPNFKSIFGPSMMDLEVKTLSICHVHELCCFYGKLNTIVNNTEPRPID